MSIIRANKFQGLDAANPAIELPADGTVILASGFGGNSLAVPSGSSSTPAVAPANDPNTGIYFPEGDTIGFVEGGVEAARISPQGRLGIGLTNPESPLHVETTGETILTVEGSGVAAAGAGGLLLLKNNDTTANNINQIQSADVGGQTTSAISFANVDQANNEGDLRFLTRPSAGSLTERFRFGSAGQFGIGGATFGTSGQVLSSQGANAAPSWENRPGATWLDTENTGAGGGAITVTGIDTNARIILISFFGVSQNTTNSNQLALRVGNGSINDGSNYLWSVGRGVDADSINTATTFYRLIVDAYTSASFIFSGTITLLRTQDSSNPLWSISHLLSENGGGNEPIYGAGSFTDTLIDRIQLIPAGNFDNGRFRVGYIL